MKGKWAKGIAPRFFAWIIKEKLAVSERPGGYARNHRRVRRQEEILWLRGEGFTRVVSLLTSPHNLHAYDELDMAWAHIPFGVHDDPAVALPELFSQLRDWMAAGERLLVHQEEVNDRLMGVVAGYLRWSGMVPSGPQAITVVERILHRQMGPDGRELVAMAPQLAGAGGAPLSGLGNRTTVSAPRPRSAAPGRPMAPPLVSSASSVVIAAMAAATGSPAAPASSPAPVLEAEAAISGMETEAAPAEPDASGALAAEAPDRDDGAGPLAEPEGADAQGGAGPPDVDADSGPRPSGLPEEVEPGGSTTGDGWPNRLSVTEVWAGAALSEADVHDAHLG